MSILRPFRRADRKPDRDYLSFIRSHACCVCEDGEQRHVTEAAHTGPHAMGSKSGDRTAIPLCEIHHREGIDSYHRVGPWRFEQIHGVNIAQVVAVLNERYDAEHAGVLNAREVIA